MEIKAKKNRLFRGGKNSEKNRRIEKRSGGLLKKGQTVFLVAILAFPLLQWCVCWLYVNLSSFALAFQDPRTSDFSFVNFVQFWESLTSPYGEIGLALRNTLIYFATSLCAILPLSFVITYFLYKKIAFYKGFRVIFYFPAIISSVAMVAVYTSFIAPEGPFGILMKALGAELPPESLLGRDSTATWAIVVYNIWTGFGTNILLLSGAMTRIPTEVIESANLEGCGPWRELALIIFPLVWSTISTQIIFICTAIFNSSGPILLFTNGANRTTTLSFWIFAQVYGTGAVGGSGSYNLVSAVGLCFTLVGIPIILFVRWLTERFSAVEY